jgi:Membrane bound FAD containing D-sorbitol dehydrogenase
MDEAATFLRVSRVLTGKAGIDPNLSQTYLGRLKHLDGIALSALLVRFAELEEGGADLVTEVRDRVFGDASIAQIAKTALLLWYTGGIQTHDHPAKWQIQSAEEFFAALVWEAIGAHAPAASTGFFGHWRYEPIRGGL